MATRAPESGVGLATPGGDVWSTPIVDTVLGDPLRVPGDVGAWLRTIEQRGRELRAATEAAIAAGNPTMALAQAHVRLEQLVSDDQNSVLRRALRRPLIQLVEGTPARRTLEHLFGDLFTRADRALAVHADVMALTDELSALRARYGGRMPSLTAEHLHQARIGSDAIARVRSSSEVQAIRTRLNRVEQVLRDYEAELASTRSAELALEHVVSRDGITTGELGAAFALRLRTREGSRQVTRLQSDVQATVARHLNELEAQVAKHADRHGRQDAAAAVIEQLVEQALSRSGDASVAATGSAVLEGALAVLYNALHPREGRYGWRPPAGLLRRFAHGVQSAAATPPTDAIVLHAIPIGGDYVCLTTEYPSVVRVHSRTVRVDQVVECQVVVDDATVEDTDVAEIDLGPLFLGIDERTSAWYRTARRARIRVIAGGSDRWYGRLEEKGTVAKLEEPAWKPSPPAPGTFRVLRAPSLDLLGTPHGGGLDAPPVVPNGPVVHFLGVETARVRTGFAGAEAAWLRYPAVSKGQATNAIRREYRLLGALAAPVLDGPGARPGLAVEPIAAARLVRQKRGWPMYAIPFGLRLEDAPTLEEWIRSSVASARNVIGGIARIIMAAHDAGYALGSCDLRMFAYSAEWKSLDASPLPVPTLVTAPACAPFGETFHAPVAWEAADRYRRLRLPLLLPPVRDGQEVAKSVDAWAFAAFLLDLLMSEPLAEPPATWTDLWSRAATCSEDEFLLPGLARTLGSVMRTPDATDQVLALLRRFEFSSEWDATEGTAMPSASSAREGAE